MKSPKAPKTSTPTTTDLRARDPKVLHAEIALFRQKIADRVSRGPEKAAIILAEWVNRKPLTLPQKKSA